MSSPLDLQPEARPGLVNGDEVAAAGSSASRTPRVSDLSADLEARIGEDLRQPLAPLELGLRSLEFGAGVAPEPSESGVLAVCARARLAVHEPEGPKQDLCGEHIGGAHGSSFGTCGDLAEMKPFKACPA